LLGAIDPVGDEQTGESMKLGTALILLLGVAAIWVFAQPPARAAARDYDCADFENQAEAEEYLLPGDPYRLDADSDGIACEDLPCPCSYEAGGGGAGVVPPPPPPPYRLSKPAARHLSKQMIRGIVRRSSRLDYMRFGGCERLALRRVDCRLASHGRTATERVACQYRVSVEARNRHPVARLAGHRCRTAVLD
jgi:hypothetical protein